MKRAALFGGGIGLGAVGVALSALAAVRFGAHRTLDALFTDCDPSISDSSRIDDFYQPRMAGWYREHPSGIGTPVSSVSAQIRDQETYVHATIFPLDAVYGWSLLQTHEGTEWAQVGWEEKQGSVHHTFTNWTVSPNSAVFGTRGSITVGNAPRFKTEWNAIDGKFRFYVDGIYLDETPSESWTPAMAIVSNETWTLASQMPGTALVPAKAKGAIAMFDGTWYSLDGTIDSRSLTDPTNHAVAVVDSQTINVSDLDCIS